MKIRNGFVSNSSSSSFIIARKNATTAEVALFMLFEVLSDSIEWESDDIIEEDREQKIRAAIKWLDKNQQYNEPIFIPWTCNYSTFIWRNKYICVDTCNNHDFKCAGPEYDYLHHYKGRHNCDGDERQDKFYEGHHDLYLDLSSQALASRSELDR